MKTSLLSFATLAFGFCLVMQSASADGILKKHHAGPPVCEPGFKIIEEVVMKEVTRTVCKQVPETKKKWVYSWINDPFCVQCSKHGSCEHCKGPYCRKQLVKMQVDECTTQTKCVTESITELVPVTVYRKVPCGPDEPKAEVLGVKPILVPKK